MFKTILIILICIFLAYVGGIIFAWVNDVYNTKKAFLISSIIYTFIGLLEAYLFLN